jgi:hypothetical protein
MMTAWWAIPFALQAGLMGLDEFHFHRQRSLPLWERIGHPIDTLTVVVCYLYLWLFSSSFTNLGVYIALCAVSSLFVTKDEIVHASRCGWEEHWLHAALFMMHPIAFMAAGWAWMQGQDASAFLVLALTISGFGLYQFLYWNTSWSNTR